MSKSFIVRGSVSDYSRNAIIDEKGVLAQINDWDFSQDDDQTIVLKLTILTGTKKGTSQKDFVTFDPAAKMNWKYAALREAIGLPIADEDQFDLGSLVGQFVIIDLIPSKNGKYQNLNYRKHNKTLLDGMVAGLVQADTAPAGTTPSAKTSTTDVDIKEDDLPF